MSARRRAPRGAQPALLGALAVWALAPIAVLVVHALRFHERLTGADGVVGGDQLQYLAWARDAGSHGLAGNLFTLPAGAHVYAQPLFTISGLLWRLGLPLQLAYWLWKPVAIVVLFAGVAAWSRRLLAGRGQSTAAIVLALFLFTPLAAAAGWLELGAVPSRGQLLQVAAEMFPASELWGYLPAALAVGLLPVSLLAAERAADARGRSRRGTLALAGGAALLVAWLHPWQGVILAVVAAVLAGWGTAAQRRALAVVVIGAALPLVYYLLLSKLDSAWKLASANELVPRPPLGSLAIALLPVLALAATGVRRPGRALAERALLLWIPASLVTYFAVGSFPSHALESLSLPLAVLCVRGWGRLRLPALAGVIAIGLATLPGMAYEARAFRDVERGPTQQYYLSSSDARALDWVAADAPPGGVMARTIFAVGVPAETDRAVWVGHQFWSQDYPARHALADSLFAGTLGSARSRLAVRLSRVRVLLADCGAGADLAAILKPMLVSVHRFGCASVYVVSRALGARGP